MRMRTTTDSVRVARVRHWTPPRMRSVMSNPEDPELAIEACPFGVPAAGWLLVGALLIVASVVLLHGS